MRIVPDGALPYSIIMSGDNTRKNLYFESGVIEVTDDDWDRIAIAWDDGYLGDENYQGEPMLFSVFLKQLIELKRINE